MSYTIYVDLGYYDETTVCIVENSKPTHKVIFRTLRKELNWEEATEQLVAIGKEFKVTEDQIYVPHQPAVQAIVRKRLPTARAMRVMKKIEEEEIL